MQSDRSSLSPAHAPSRRLNPDAVARSFTGCRMSKGESMNRSNRLLSAVLLAFAAAATGACAHGPPVVQSAVEILDRTEGRVLPIYWHNGQRYVVGKPGNEYSIRVRNGSPRRVLAVMSVDGVNVITGDTASPRQSGYVLAPYETTEIAGWRTSL